MQFGYLESKLVWYCCNTLSHRVIPHLQYSSCENTVCYILFGVFSVNWIVSSRNFYCNISSQFLELLVWFQQSDLLNYGRLFQNALLLSTDGGWLKCQISSSYSKSTDSYPYGRWRTLCKHWCRNLLQVTKNNPASSALISCLSNHKSVLLVRMMLVRYGMCEYPR